MKKITLFKDEKNCSACGACVNICPTDSISMKSDFAGFLYPHIDESKCIKCQKCIKACNFQHENNGSEPINVYVASAKHDNILKISASGGAFAVFAEKILQEKGVVFGCAMTYINKKLDCSHIMIDSVKDLPKLQGSKYVMSKTQHTFREVKTQLETGRKVLFSGTPCQIDGLIGYLGNKKYDNLITVDIICHGVPSEKMFHDYIRTEEKKHKMSVVKFDFRSKQNGWGSFVFTEHCRTDERKEVVLNKFARYSSYYWLFLNGVSYRENCYSCKYADKKRISDLTIGDYWGIEKVHPELVEESSAFDMKKGISCILVNSENGQSFIEQCADIINLKNSSFEAAAMQNGQLNKPTKRHQQRDIIMETYHQKGYEAVDKWYQKHLGFKKYIYLLWDSIPVGFKSKLKKILKSKR